MHNAKYRLPREKTMQNATVFVHVRRIARGLDVACSVLSPRRLIAKDSAMKSISSGQTAATLLALMILPALSTSADKETPSSVDMQKHNVAIGSAIAQAAGVEQLVAAYHQRTNNFPGSNAEAGVKPAASLASPDVTSIEVTSGGSVVVTLTATSGIDGGTIVFTPATNTDESSVDWTCKSPSYSTIADDTGGVCEYSKLP
jgi:Pilin (bacterial filament)